MATLTLPPARFSALRAQTQQLLMRQPWPEGLVKDNGGTGQQRKRHGSKGEAPGPLSLQVALANQLCRGGFSIAYAHSTYSLLCRPLCCCRKHVPDSLCAKACGHRPPPLYSAYPHCFRREHDYNSLRPEFCVQRPSPPHSTQPICFRRKHVHNQLRPEPYVHGPVHAQAQAQRTVTLRPRRVLPGWPQLPAPTLLLPQP